MAHARSPRLLAAALFLVFIALPPTVHGAPVAKRKPPCANANVAPSAGNLPTVRAAVLCLHNRERSARGLAPLREHRRLRKAAESHASDMVAGGYFSHDAPSGEDMVDRILGTGYARGAGWSLGENIGYGTGPLATAAQIHRAWMRSPGHKANIVKAQFREIGVGIALGAPVDAQGLAGATYTADFGVRR
jgi:uncharacterized protein YkwD